LISNSELFGVGTSAASWFKLPYAFTFETERFGEAIPSGAIGLALMLAPLALMTLINRGPAARKAAILLAVGAVYFGCLAYVMQYGRYYIPVLPVMALAAVIPLVHVFKKWLQRSNLVLLGVAVAAQVALSPLLFWNIPERFPIEMAFGFEDRESLLSRSLAVYRPVQFLNKKMEPGHKVLVVGNRTARIYLNGQMATYGDPEVIQIVNESTPGNLASNLVESGFTYLCVDFANPESTWGLPYTADLFLKRFATLEHSTNTMKVYRLHKEVKEAKENDVAQNLLANPGFEASSKANYVDGWILYGQPLIARTPENAHSGTIAVRADADDGLYARVRVKADKGHSFGYWCRADKPGQTALLQVAWLDSQFQRISVSMQVVPVGPQWEWRSFSAISPPGVVEAYVYLSVYQNSEVWFDDCLFVQGELPVKQ
jgi:hypothetical protein